MNNTRISSPVMLLSLGAGVILLLALGFIAWVNLSEANIDFSGLTLRRVSPREPVVPDSSGAIAESLPIYWQSEHNYTVADPGAVYKGMEVFHAKESERNYTVADPGAVYEGMEVFHARESER